MRTLILKRAWQAFGQAHFVRPSWSVTAISALLLAASSVIAGPTVSWVSGGPNTGFPSGAGYADGDTVLEAEYHTPCGMAMDVTGQYLFIADRDNNAIRYLDLAAGWTWTFGVSATNLVSKPVGVAVDNSYNVYVLNYGKGTNGSLVTFDNWGDVVATNATRLTNAAGMSMDTSGNIYITVNSNKLIRISSATLYFTNVTTVTNITVSATNIVSTTNITTTATPTTNRTVIATIPYAGASLQGIVVKRNGLIAACDSGRNGIYLIDPATSIITTNAGFHGAGDFTTNGNNMASSSTAKFNQPMNVAETGDGSLIVTDYGNHRVKRVMTTGVVTNLYGVNAADWVTPYKGFMDGIVKVPDLLGGVAARLPFGVVLALDGSVYVTEDYYHIVRHITGAGLALPPPPPPLPPAAPTDLMATTNIGVVNLTWTGSANATNYNIKRSNTTGGPYLVIGTRAITSFADSNVVSGMTYYYVVSALNAGGQSTNSSEVSATLPWPPVADPQIGYVDGYGIFHVAFSVFFNNDVPIVIESDPTALTTYTYSNTASAALVPNPTTNSTSAGAYQDGFDTTDYIVAEILPTVSIKAISVKHDGSPDSQISQATFQFIVGNPAILGNNAAQFYLDDVTVGAHLYYTTDGSDPSPTNVSAVNIGTAPSSTNWTVSLGIQTNTLFKVRGFRDNYQPSAISSNLFTTDNFIPNAISFGFAAGEASSDFIASPGQTFYAPVTLTPLSATKIYSMQFNLTVTNAGPIPGPAIASGAFAFTSMLKKPDPDIPGYYVQIPPYMFISTNNTVVQNPVYYEGSTNFISLMTTNLAANLLGVGWVERITMTNLYDTKAQDLIQFSQAHDTLFQQGGGQVLLGGYAFQVPTNAAPGQTYQIQIGRPSATADGVGAPGSSVYIFAPTNGSMARGSINAIKNVTAGQRKYLVGDAYPFRWFNAGDFGNTNLESADVQQVFNSAIYNLNSPVWQAPGSDFADAMDSCGATYMDLGKGYLELDSTITDPNLLNLLFDGNDTTINQIAFGDGVLDVCDVYVTYRRSLDSSLTLFQRFWTNGVRVAQTAPNTFNPGMVSKSLTAAKPSNLASKSISITNQPKVIFTAGDIQANAGQTISIPITASILGSYPLRVLMLNLTVVPLDGSPALTAPVSFSYNTDLGSPWTTAQQGNGNYSAVWLNGGIAGLTGTASLGTLTVTIPANATSSSAYAVHFDHASASPNGIASFSKLAKTGLITLANRSGSSYKDGIPDSWRLRYFLTLNNYLSATNADADGDGLNNLQEYLAGTDPTDPTSFFKNIGTDRSAAQSCQDCVISWPSAIGKQYIILRASNLVSPIWTSIATNSGTGNVMEYHDMSGGANRYYRVSVQ